jgi:hypothetical protein
VSPDFTLDDLEATTGRRRKRRFSVSELEATPGAVAIPPPCPKCEEEGGGRYARPGEEPWCWGCHCERLGGDRESIPEPGLEAGSEQRGVLQILDTRKLLTSEPPPLDWLAEGVFCRGKLTLFGGREKRGKSLVALALAVCMASGGGEVAGIRVKPGRVLLVDAENGEREIHRRLRAMGLAPKHAENLVIAEARGFELREHLYVVADLARRHRVDLVTLDSFRSLWHGDERDEAEVAAALDPVRDLAHGTETGFSLVHHAQKAGEEYRGSSAIGACIDWCVMLDREREDKDKARRRLANPLARFAPERPDQWMRICSEGDEGRVSLEAAESFVREHQAPARDEIEAKLRAFIEGGHGATAYTEGGTVAPPSWSAAELGRKINQDSHSGTFRRALQRLADAGVIHRNGDGHWQRSGRLFDNEEDQ